MKCPYCNSIVLQATLISNTELRCDHCRRALTSPHAVNFQEIVEKERGNCPYCGQFNSGFKPITGGLICRKCGLVFKIKRITYKASAGITCPNCQETVHRFLMFSRSQCACPSCHQVFELPSSVDIPRIALTGSGTCPACSKKVFHFSKEAGTFICDKCGDRLEILLPPKIALALFVELVNGTSEPQAPRKEAVSESASPKPVSSVKLQATEKTLIRVLGQARSLEEIALILRVEFANYLKMSLLAQIGEVVSDEQNLGKKTKMWEECLWLGEMVLTTINEPDSEAMDSIHKLLNDFAAMSYNQGIDSLAIVSYGLEHALSICQNNKQLISNLCDVIHVACPKCKLQFNARAYRVIHSNSPIAATINKSNVIECPFCNFTGRVPISMAFCDSASNSVRCYLNDEDYLEYEKNQKIEWLDTYLASLPREAIFTNRTITNQIEEFFSWLTKPEAKGKSQHERIRIYAGDLGHTMSVFRLLGASYFSHKMYDLAAHAYEIAIRFDPLDPQNYEGVAAAFAALGRNDDAMAMLNQSTSIAKAEVEGPARAITIETELPPRGMSGPINLPPFFLSQNLTPLSTEEDTELHTTLVRELWNYMKQFPDDQQMCFFLGTAFQKLEKTNDMIRAYLKTIVIQPEYSEIAQGSRLMLGMKLGREQMVEYLQEQLL